MIICILLGKGVEKDQHKAMEWFKYVNNLYIMIMSHCPSEIYKKNIVFLARDVIYTSRAYAMMSVSVCLSVCL